MSAATGEGVLTLEVDMGGRLGRPWKGVKALRRVWDGESDQNCLPSLSKKASQVFIDNQDEMMGGESVMSLVPCEPTGSSFSTPGFTPGFTPDSRSNSIALHRTCSDRFTHRFNANVVHDLTPSHSIPIPTDRPFKARTEPSAQAFPHVRFPERECQSNSHFPRNIPTTFPNSVVR
jgi:hypothetical protein